jgi:hypothetical protein
MLLCVYICTYIYALIHVAIYMTSLLQFDIFSDIDILIYYHIIVIV